MQITGRYIIPGEDTNNQFFLECGIGKGPMLWEGAILKQTTVKEGGKHYPIMLRISSENYNYTSR